jgi:cytochrome c oxidase cbb3-type subunit 3
VFAFIYFFLFQVYDIGKNPTQEYAAELQAAGFAKTERLKTAAASVDEASVVQLADATSLAAGKAIFISKCVACHGNNGEGNVGPNLTDDYWIHGGTVNEMFKTVKYGVPAKGMVPWQGILKPEEMQDAVSYIMTLHGTNPANAKAPQGVLYNPSAAAVDSTTAVTDTTKLKI